LGLEDGVPLWGLEKGARRSQELFHLDPGKARVGKAQNVKKLPVPEGKESFGVEGKESDGKGIPSPDHDVVVRQGRCHGPSFGGLRRDPWPFRRFSEREREPLRPFSDKYFLSKKFFLQKIKKKINEARQFESNMNPGSFHAWKRCGSMSRPIENREREHYKPECLFVIKIVHCKSFLFLWFCFILLFFYFC
jgi:hypothetical protein